MDFHDTTVLRNVAPASEAEPSGYNTWIHSENWGYMYVYVYSKGSLNESSLRNFS